MIMIMLTFFNT